MKRTIILVLVVVAFSLIVNSESNLSSMPGRVTGTVDITIHCTPASGYTCKLYNCDGTWTGKQCGPTNSNGKCGVLDVTSGCYFFVIDNGAQTCSGAHFQFDSGFMYTYHFYCGSNCNPYGPSH